MQIRDIVEVEDEGGEQLAVVTLPLPNGLQVLCRPLLHPLELLWGELAVAGGFQLPRQGGGWGPAAADETVTAGFGIVNLDGLLLRWWLAVCDVALLAGVGALALSSDRSCA